MKEAEMAGGANQWGRDGIMTMTPTITMWNRLEGRPRAADFDRALKAEVRDAAWMLARQYQMGEFLGDDSGSPVSARLMIERTRLTKYRARDSAPEAFDEAMPIEATIERRPIPLPLNVRAQLGRQWARMIASIGAFDAQYRALYPFAAPDPAARADAPLTAHPEVWQALAAAAGRLIDGGALYLHLRQPGSAASDGIQASPASGPALDSAGAQFLQWVDRLFVQPGPSDAWDPPRLEYRCACSAPEPAGESVLVAREHRGGRIDWQSFEFQVAPPTLGAVAGAPAASDVVATDTVGLIPNQIAFAGMPNARWWAFEDGRTNFGNLNPGTTDIAALLVAEFGLVYSNDWYLLPYAAPVGSLLRVRGLAVTNVFGERTWIEPSAKGQDSSWAGWSMFTINREGDQGKPADVGLVVLPTTPKSQQGEPFEEAYLLRDELANMVWGVEKTILSAAGYPKGAADAGHELRAWFDRHAPPQPAAVDAKAPVRYDVMGRSTPENWIPFLPVQVPASVLDPGRALQLQRAAMPRFVPGDPDPIKIEPRTSLLREGLDQGLPYFVHEEEVPRAGTALRQGFNRTRWLGGRTYVWVSVTRRGGKGEGSSGLAFDQLVPTEPPAA
jgi:hypothetical protein